MHSSYSSSEDTISTTASEPGTPIKHSLPPIPVNTSPDSDTDTEEMEDQTSAKELDAAIKDPRAILTATHANGVGTADPYIIPPTVSSNSPKRRALHRPFSAASIPAGVVPLSSRPQRTSNASSSGSTTTPAGSSPPGGSPYLTNGASPSSAQEQGLDNKDGHGGKDWQELWKRGAGLLLVYPKKEASRDEALKQVSGEEASKPMLGDEVPKRPSQAEQVFGEEAPRQVSGEKSLKRVSWDGIPKTEEDGTNQEPAEVNVKPRLESGDETIKPSISVEAKSGEIHPVQAPDSQGQSVSMPQGTSRDSAPTPQASSGTSRDSAPIPQASSSTSHDSAPIPQASSGTSHDSAPIPQASSGTSHDSAPIPQASSGTSHDSAPIPQASSGMSHDSAPIPQASSGTSHDSAPNTSTASASGQQEAANKILLGRCNSTGALMPTQTNDDIVLTTIGEDDHTDGGTMEMRKRINTFSPSSKQMVGRRTPKEIKKVEKIQQKTAALRREASSTTSSSSVLKYLSPDMEAKIYERICRSLGEKYGSLERATHAAVTIQKAYRGYKLRKHFDEIRKEGPTAVRQRTATVRDKNRKLSIKSRPLHRDKVASVQDKVDKINNKRNSPGRSRATRIKLVGSGEVPPPLPPPLDPNNLPLQDGGGASVVGVEGGEAPAEEGGAEGKAEAVVGEVGPNGGAVTVTVSVTCSDESSTEDMDSCDFRMPKSQSADLSRQHRVSVFSLRSNTSMDGNGDGRGGGLTTNLSASMVNKSINIGVYQFNR